MTQLAEQELRLTLAIEDAEDILSKIKAARVEMQKVQASLTKNMKDEKAECVQLLAELDKARKALSQELHESRSVANHIQGHAKWKDAVRALWGQDGVNACIEHMQSQAEEKNA